MAVSQDASDDECRGLQPEPRGTSSRRIVIRMGAEELEVEAGSANQF